MPSSHLLVRILALETVLLAGTVVLLIGQAIWLWWHRRRSLPILTWGQQVLSATVEGHPLSDADLRRLRRLPVRLQTKLLVEVGGDLDGTERERFARLARALGLVSRAEVLCRSRLWWRRLHGVRLLVLWGGGETDVPSLLADPHAEVRAQAAEWSVHYPHASIIDGLLALLTDPSGVCRFTAQNTLLRLQGLAVAPLARYLTVAPPHGIETALQVAQGVAGVDLQPLALGLARHESPRARVFVAGLLAALGGREETVELVRLLKDPSPVVRAAAARGLGALAYWPSAPQVAALLRDRAWQVRREAGLALRAMGAPGVLFLRRALTSDDRFAADMAQQVLNLPGLVA